MVDFGNLSMKALLGVVLTIIGLLMLIYTYLVAYAYVINPLLIDQTYLIRIIILIIMASIGGYLLKKGSGITEITMRRAIIFLVLGVGMLVHSFLTANIFAIVGYGASILLFVLIMFLVIMVGIGLTLTKIGISDFLWVHKGKSTEPTGMVTPPAQPPGAEGEKKEV
jgi:hypothetical protein